MIEVLTVLLAHDPTLMDPCTHGLEVVVTGVRGAGRVGGGREETGGVGKGVGGGGRGGKVGGGGKTVHPSELLTKPKWRFLRETLGGGVKARRAHAFRWLTRAYHPLRSYYLSSLATAFTGLCVGLLAVPLATRARRWRPETVAFAAIALIVTVSTLCWEAFLGYLASCQFLARVTEGDAHLALSEFRTWGITGVGYLLAVYAVLASLLACAAWRKLGGRASLRLAPLLVLPFLTGLWFIRLGLAVA